MVCAVNLSYCHDNLPLSALLPPSLSPHSIALLQVCAICCIRMRVLYKDKTCLMCKSELKKVVVTKSVLTPFECFELKELPYDKPWEIYFETVELMNKMQRLREIRCPTCGFDDCKKLSR